MDLTSGIFEWTEEWCNEAVDTRYGPSKWDSCNGDAVTPCVEGLMMWEPLFFFFDG